MNTELSAYTDRESALLWLSRHLDGREDVDIKVMYHLNILNNLYDTYQEEIIRMDARGLPSLYEGLHQGGRRNVQATALLRGVFGAIPQEP